MASCSSSSSAPETKRPRNNDDELAEDLVDPLEALREELLSAVASNAEKVNGAMAKAFKGIESRMDKRFEGVAVEIAAVKDAQTKTDLDQKKMWERIGALQAALEVCEKDTNLKQQPTDDFDRQIDATIIRIHSQELVTLEEIKKTVESWAAEVAVSDFTTTVTGGAASPAQRFTVSLGGVPATAAKRATKLLGTLRKSDGTWRRMQCASPNGRQVDLFIGPDKSPKQVRTEILGKQLVQAIKETHPQLPIHLLRRDGVVKTNWTSFVKVEPSSHDVAVLRWDERVVAEKGIRKEDIAEAFERLAKGRDQPQWS